MVHQYSIASYQDQKPSISKAAAHSGKLVQPSTQIGIVRPYAAISHRGPVRADHLTRPTLANLVSHLEVSHSLSLYDGRHHFFALRSFSIALSSMASASNFFSLRF